MNFPNVNISGLKIDCIDYNSLLDFISDSISGNEKTNIAYANANTINLIFSDKNFLDTLNSFDIVHPDGMGIYLSSKFLFGKNGLEKRITGSDFYPILAREASKNYWKIFFFGHDDETLRKIEAMYPNLNICGSNEGYNFDNEKLISKINLHKPDILIVGLGSPKQENWIQENTDKIDYKVCLAVGDGIKVFANTKSRGPVIFRKLGLEWLVRLIKNPFKYWKRYIIGNPLFLYRIFKLKMSKFVK